MNLTNEITVALAGNPNSGKTTVFNNLTGSHQHVGNWPGVTVEKKEGICGYKGYHIRVVDLPGVYGLTAYSPDEVIARDFIVDEKPDAVVDIVDGSNLERNLYLTVQLLEMGARVIVALNMMDEVNARNLRVDIEGLSRLLGAPVVPMVASRNEGTEELFDEIVRMAQREVPVRGLVINYGREVEEEIAKLERLFSQDGQLCRKYSPRWLAVKLLEGDEDIVSKFNEVGVG